MVTGKDERFPRRTLLPFTVRSQADNPGIAALQFESKRRTCSQRQAVAQAAGSELNVRNSLGRRMACKQRVVFMELFQVLIAETPQTPQGGIQRAGGMAFGQ